MRNLKIPFEKEINLISYTLASSLIILCVANNEVYGTIAVVLFIASNYRREQVGKYAEAILTIVLPLLLITFVVTLSKCEDGYGFALMAVAFCFSVMLKYNPHLIKKSR